MRLTNKKEWERLSSSEIIQYLISRGFEDIVTFKNEYEDIQKTQKFNETYPSINGLEGEKFEIVTRENILKFTKILGDLHNCGEGFIKPPGVKIKTEWGKSIEKYRTLTRTTERYIKTIKERGAINNFEVIIGNSVEHLMNKAQASLKILKSPQYLDALERSMNLKEICLNSICDNTAVINDGKIIIVNVFNLSYNMTLEDLGSLIKKCSGKNNTQNICGEIVESYSNIRPLDENSKVILKAIVDFPYDSIKIINRYCNGKGQETVLIEKFKKYYERDLMAIWR